MLVNLGTAIKVCSPCLRLHATVGLEFCVTHGDCCGCCGRWRIVFLTTICTTLPSPCPRLHVADVVVAGGGSLF